MIDRLDAEGLLPAITFIFSRAGCDAAVSSACAPGCGCSTRPRTRRDPRRSSRRAAPTSRAEDLHVLGYYEWLDGLERGIAAHHAGMLPTFKEVVEELFVRGLVKAVFATETLALGINMPARSVVLERLVKWNGEATPTSRRGSTPSSPAGPGGAASTSRATPSCCGSRARPAALAGLASTRTYPLRSSFRPSYNMAVNLVGQVGRERGPRAAASRRSRSSRPTGRWSGWPGRSPATRRPWPATARR